MSTHPDLAGGRLTINLAALVENYQRLAGYAGSAKCAAVVKANAYGCGTEPCITVLREAGCDVFFVALPQEALRARIAAPDAEIYVLNGVFSSAASYLVDAKTWPVLGSVPEIDTWISTAKGVDRPLPCIIHVDTGMNRLGLTLDELAMLAEDEERLSHLDIRYLMTHYACADEAGHPMTQAQRQAFEKAAGVLAGVPLAAANSAADLQRDGHEFDLVRAGIALFGGEALKDTPNQMRPVATLEARIIQIRSVPAGGSVGYGATEMMERDSRIALVSVGYADGYLRSASHAGVPLRSVTPGAYAAFKGTRINGVGRISMDMSAFDVTDIPADKIAAGDWIELFGETVPVDDVARASGTIGYELLTSIGNRYHRRYVA